MLSCGHIAELLPAPSFKRGLSVDTIKVYSAHLLITVLGFLAVAYAARPGLSVAVRRIIFVMAPATVLLALAHFSVPKGASVYNDFTLAYYPAGQAVLDGRDALAAVLKGGGFVNLPAMAWLFAPLALLSQVNAIALFTLVGIAATVAGWSLLAEAADLDTKRAGLLFMLFAANGPIFYSIRMGNTSHVVLLILVLAMLLLRSGRQLLAGALIGLAGIIKLPLLLLPAYFALRGRWRVAFGSGAVVGSVVVLSVVLFDWQLLVQWYERCVEPFAEHPMAAYNVQSIHAALLRFNSGLDAVHLWEPQPLSSWAATTSMVLTFLLLTAAGVAVAKGRIWAKSSRLAHAGHRADELEFLLMLVLALLLSPMSWVHYYCWLLIPAAFLLNARHHFQADRASIVMAWLGLGLASFPVVIPYFSHTEWREYFFRTAQSHFLFGAILMFGALLRARLLLTPSEPVHGNLATPESQLAGPR